MFVLLSVCGFSVWDRKCPVIEGGWWWAWSALLCLWFLVPFASEEGLRYAFVSTLTIYPPSCPPTFLLSFLPSFYVFCCVWFPKQSKNVWNCFNYEGIEWLLAISSFLSLSSDLISWDACTFLIPTISLTGFIRFHVHNWNLLAVNFKAAPINIFIITTDQRTMCNIKGVAQIILLILKILR